MDVKKTRRNTPALLLIILTAVTAALSFSGCDFVFPHIGAAESIPLIDSGIVDKYRDEYRQYWRYEHLEPRLKEGYAEVYAALKEGFEQDVIISVADNGSTREYTGIKVRLSMALRSKEEAQLLYTALIWDNPQLFYISNQYSYEGYRVGDINHYNIFCLVFTMNAEERIQSEHRLNSVLNGMFASRDDDTSMQQTGLQILLHDRLLELCDYDYEAAAAENPAQLFPDALTAYGALVNGSALCEGYARAMQLLMYQAGMKCTLVSGIDTATGTPHMWNFVMVDGRSYHLDPTWNDGGDYVHHTFFNLTTASILRTHSIDQSNVGIDTCSSYDSQYYRFTGGFLDTSLSASVSAVIAERVAVGGDTIDLQFSRAAFEEGASFISDKSALITRVNGRLAGTGAFMWNYRVYTNDIYHTVTIVKQP